MSDAHEKDRWRELADLLGLPPEHGEQTESGSPAASHAEPEFLEPEQPIEIAEENGPEPVSEASFEEPTFEPRETTVLPSAQAEPDAAAVTELTNEESDTGE